MRSHTKTRNAAPTFVSLLAVPQYVQADLVQCEDCCKGGSYEHLTITSFDSNVTSDGPLSWTMGGPYSWDYSNDKSKDQLWRDFYLNTPPNLNLTETSDYSGCALFFYNATAALQTDTGFDDYASFSCDTVMASQCQQDLNQQALDDLALVLSPNNGLDLDTAGKADICGTLANRFADRKIPQSCSFYVQQPTWGYTTGQGRLRLTIDPFSCSKTNLILQSSWARVDSTHMVSKYRSREIALSQTTTPTSPCRLNPHMSICEVGAKRSRPSRTGPRLS